MRLKLISCEVLFRELCATVARSRHEIDLEFLPKGLHDLGGRRMRGLIQERIDAVPPDRYQAVLLGYGLCGNGALGLAARRIPLVAVRAHDCIAMLMGSSERYQTYFAEHSGVYFRSPGWLERGENTDQLTLEESRRRSGTGQTKEQLIEKYGEDDGLYLWKELTSYSAAYRQLTYIRTGVEPDGTLEASARREAAERGWQFDAVDGSLRIFKHLVDAEWNGPEFLVVPPGHSIRACYDGAIMGID